MSDEATKTKNPRAPRVKDTDIIHLNKNAEGVQYSAENNPKRQGSKRSTRFVHYRDGMTVGEAKAAGLTPADMRSDKKRNFITIVPGTPAPAAAEAPAVAA